MTLLEKAADLMIKDGGAENTGDLNVPYKELTKVAEAEGLTLELVEKFLNSLTEEEFETFCIGDDEEQKLIAARSNTGFVAHVVLDELFMHVLNGEV